MVIQFWYVKLTKVVDQKKISMVYLPSIYDTCIPNDGKVGALLRDGKYKLIHFLVTIAIPYQQIDTKLSFCIVTDTIYSFYNQAP